MSARPSERGPGEGLLAPGPLLAVALLALNDQLLKGVGPGWLTGKLSDVAGLAFFPLLLQGLAEVGLAALGRPWGPSRRVLGVAVAITGAVFAAVQLWPPATEAWSWGLGALQWPFLVLVEPGARWRPVATWPDPTDLLALPALALAWRWGQGSRSHAEATPRAHAVPRRAPDTDPSSISPVAEEVSADERGGG